MYWQIILLGAVLSGSTLASNGPASAPATTTAPTVIYATGDPAKVRPLSNSQSFSTNPVQKSQYAADMSNFHDQLQTDPLFTSMRNVLKTAIPQSYKDAMSTNPASVKAQFKTAAPEWYQSLPSDVKSFMEYNAVMASSIYSKDFAAPTGQPAKGSGNGASSEASQLSLVGATVCAVLGAFGVAALLL
jgi:hypothetical protein